MQRYGKGRVLAFSFMVVILSACELLVEDHTEAEFAQTIVGQCFKINHPSFLYKTTCAVPDSKFSAIGKCYSIQAFGNRKNGIDTPNSMEAYLAKREYWDNQMFNQYESWKSRYRTISFSVEKGTKLVPKRMLSYPMDESTRVWVVRAYLLSDEFKDIEIELPVHGNQLSPYWVKPHHVVEPVVAPDLVEEFVTRCDGEEFTPR